MKSTLILFFLAISSIFAFAQVTEIKLTKEEDKVTDFVANLPVVTHADNYVRKVSKGKRHLSMLFVRDPTPGDNYYEVDVVEDNGSTYYTHLIFLVAPKTYAVK